VARLRGFEPPAFPRTSDGILWPALFRSQVSEKRIDHSAAPVSNWIICFIWGGIAGASEMGRLEI
jgi:hypothetical protein